MHLAETIKRAEQGRGEIHRRSWKSREPSNWPSWMEWFNNRRLLEPIGYIPPAEAQAAYYRDNPRTP